jgi:hypothetical protein
VVFSDQSFLVLFLVLFRVDLRVLVFAERFSETRAAARSSVALSFDAADFGVIFFSAIQVLLLEPWASERPASDLHSMSNPSPSVGGPGHSGRVSSVTTTDVTLVGFQL